MIKYTLLTVAMFFGIAILAQKTELPMKNDMIYYSTEDIKMTNTKKCLSAYFDWYKIWDKCESLSSEIRRNSRNDKKYTDLFFVSIGPKDVVKGMNKLLDCHDTINGELKISLPGNMSPFFIRDKLNNKHILEINITATVQIIFLSKDSYKVKTKGFTYIASIEEDNQIATTNLPLEELYFGYKNADKVSKDETYMYEDINASVLGFQRMLNEYLKAAYKTDELD